MIHTLAHLSQLFVFFFVFFFGLFIHTVDFETKPNRTKSIILHSFGPIGVKSPSETLYSMRLFIGSQT